MNFDYDSLVALSAVVREGSFEQASKTLKVTQSAVSQRIKQLEDRVGAVLVVRGRPCVATDVGLQLCQHLEQVKLLQHEVLDRIGPSVTSDTGQPAVLRIAVNLDSLATWFPEVMRRAYLELNLLFEVSPDDQEFTDQSLRSGESMAAVTSNEAPVQGCRRTSLGSMEYLAVASPGYISRYFKDGVTVDALRTSPCIAFDRKDTLLDRWMVQCFGEAVAGYQQMLPSYEGYLQCCLDGTGWGMMPSITAAKHITAGTLVELVPGQRVMVSLHWKSSTQPQDIMNKLSALVLEEAEKHMMPDKFRPN